ncbi:MAG: type IV pilus twitching motility protein PilT [Patescibacteria group bacterium]
MSDIKEKIDRLLSYTSKLEASDLHISVGHHPIVRVNGKLQKIREENKIDAEEAKLIAFEIATKEQREKFIEKKEVDFSYQKNGGDRFRVNIFNQSKDISCALRRIPPKIKTLEELNLPKDLYEFARASQGLVLVTGPTSHGKSTTLATLIDEINKNQFKHIITIEDPIEYIFDDDKALIDQREVGQDTDSFAKALKSSFRQDPDVIMVGEMRDPETIETAITAAETGHLVFSTLHTNSASQTIHRIVDSFPANQQGQIRAQLSASLLGIISQRLLPRKSGGLIPACEVLKNNSAISNLIRENKIHELDITVETSSKDGMISLNKYLSDLVKNNEITLEDAITYSSKPKSLRKLID